MQVLPVKPERVLYAKLKLQLILTLVPAALVTAAVLFVIMPEPLFVLLIPVCVVLFTVFMALFGLFLGLKMPNLKWTNETVPVKQSMGVSLALFGRLGGRHGFGRAVFRRFRLDLSRFVSRTCMQYCLPRCLRRCSPG